MKCRFRPEWAAAVVCAVACSGQIQNCDGLKSAELAVQAKQALAAGNPAGAGVLFRQSFDACSTDRHLLLDGARALTSARDFPAAIKTAEEYLRGDQHSPAGLLVLANALFMAQRWEDAAPVLERLLTAQPDNNVALLLQANNLYLLGDTGKAEQVLLKVLDHNPSDTDAAYSLGRIYYMGNRAEFAAGQFHQVVKLDPSHYKAWDNLGLCYDALGKPEEAVRYFLKSIQLVEKAHPEYHWPYTNLSDLLLRQNRYDEAFGAAVEAAKRSPRTARNFYLAGQALVKLGQDANAARWLERAVAIDSGYPEALYALGQLYMRTGQKERAAETLSQFRIAKANAPKKRR